MHEYNPVGALMGRAVSGYETNLAIEALSSGILECDDGYDPSEVILLSPQQEEIQDFAGNTLTPVSGINPHL